MTGPLHIRVVRAAVVELARPWRALLVGLMLAGLTSPARADDAPIIVTVWGLRYADGVVHVDVCTRETFLRSTCPYSAKAPARIGETTVIVPDVPPGVYAIQAYHDFNDNERVDRNPLGVPKEGIAFSQDAPLGLHGPSFDQAAFTHGSTPQALRLRLHRFRRAPRPESSGERP
jgi:uncharacterized protein (DUF2141 family)